MGTKPSKAQDNVFCKARLEAAKYNDSLKSREGAAAALGYGDASTVAKWELGTTKPSPEAVLMMSEVYGAPELANYYCAHMCPIGPECGIEEVKVEDLDRITIRALVGLKQAQSISMQLLQVTADGSVSRDERKRLDSIVTTLDSLEQATESLKMWIRKNL